MRTKLNGKSRCAARATCFDKETEPDITILDEDFIPSRDYHPLNFCNDDDIRISVGIAIEMKKLSPEEFRFFLLVLRRASANHGYETVISSSDITRIAKLTRQEAITARESLVQKELIRVRAEENLEGDRHWEFYSIPGGEKIWR
ncbi:MAG TPA: hypothetical protein P5115_20200 [Spirochaetota bacterium]|nr:hypothetical protein [Spirochaetota bacterium]